MPRSALPSGGAVFVFGVCGCMSLGVRSHGLPVGSSCVRVVIVPGACSLAVTVRAGGHSRAGVVPPPSYRLWLFIGRALVRRFQFPGVYPLCGRGCRARSARSSPGAFIHVRRSHSCAGVYPFGVRSSCGRSLTVYPWGGRSKFEVARDGTGTLM